VLAFEVLLVRAFSIVFWHHFAAMAISIALLGYGLSGTLLSFAAGRLQPIARTGYAALSLAFAVGVLLSLSLAGRLPVNMLELAWDGRQALLLSVLYLLLMLPFLFAATAIGLALMTAENRVGAVYRSDLLGAAAGAVGAVALLFLAPLALCLKAIGALAAVAALLGRPAKRTAGAVALALVLVALWPISWLSPQPSAYKELSQTLHIPGTRIIAERSSPLSQLSVVESAHVRFRHAPGLSLNTTVEPPDQLAVFSDGGSPTAITRFDGRLEPLAYLDRQTAALAFHLRPKPRTLVLGAGGGSDVLLALRFDAPVIDAVELDPALVGLLAGPFAAFSGDLFRHPRVRVHVAEARHFASRSGDFYDIVQISLLDSFASAAGGTHALAEGALYTVEALGQYLDRLAPGGFVAITRWLNTPPRDSLRVFATAVEALERRGIADPSHALVMINGWRTVTILIKNGVLSAAETATVRAFAAEHGFDVAFIRGGTAAEASRFHSFERPYLYEAAQALLSRERARFLAEYPFDVAPTTDDRPYFFRFLKLGTLLDLLALPQRSGLNLIEWGYPLLLLTLVQAAVVSLILIVAPLAFLKRQPGGSTARARVFVALYFAALGLAFLFIEVAFIQRLQIFLGQPIYAVSATLAGFLLFAGLGSGFSQRWASEPWRGVVIAVAAIALATVAAIALIAFALPLVAGSSLAVRLGAVLVLIAPLAFAMGMPFPLGLTLTRMRARSLVPWAWGVNGCASVLSPLLASLLAIHLGFTVVLALAIALYAVAAASLLLMRAETG
jgi:hypothetical protein